MSIELLLLLALFVLLPLIQRLLEAARQRDGSTPERAEGQPAPPQRGARRGPQPPSDAPRPRTPRPVKARHRWGDEMPARERAPARDLGGLVAPAPAARRSARGYTAVPGLENPLEKRRAIVLMTILGPCRAVSPHDWPERADRR